MEEKQEIQNEDIIEEKLSFNLENFSGPLDLLLALIRKNKLEIEDVEISKLTEQYLEVMKDISTVDMEVASEFIEYAAILIEIKSKKLLPKINEDPEDEIDEQAASVPEYVHFIVPFLPLNCPPPDNLIRKSSSAFL